MSNESIETYSQNPVLNGYLIESELEDIIHNGYHKSHLGYNIVDWFVNKVIKLENKMAF